MIFHRSNSSGKILHDWSDLYAAKILIELRRAALPDTKLVIVDIIMQYACHDPSSGVQGDDTCPTVREAPTPLLANFGSANDLSYTLDAAVSSGLSTAKYNAIANTFWTFVSLT